MITTAGYRDILHIGRHQRPQHYSIRQEIPWQDRPLVRRRNRRAVAERLANLGATTSELETSAERLAESVSTSSRSVVEVASAAEDASANVQTVASASEELSCSIEEISQQVNQSNEIVATASARLPPHIKGLIT